VYAPAAASSATIPAVFIGADASKQSLVDTTDATGASRSVFVRTGLLANPSKVDSVVVLISASYKGKPIGNPIRVKLATKLSIGG
jgi:hypothetical protein